MKIMKAFVEYLAVIYLTSNRLLAFPLLKVIKYLLTKGKIG